ncbi:MAG: glycosyltransferase family 2 protein [Nitrospirae bacterium]|nr:glycosyltransferase family 2 protein [Nitrospirota bacterium]
MIEGKRVSLILPCLDEENGLRMLLKNIPSAVDETIVVDNGSTDKTAAIGREAGARVVHEPRRGYGRACLRGLTEARGEILVVMDGDGTYPVNRVETVVSKMVREKYDFLVTRRLPLGTPSIRSRLRRLGCYVLDQTARLLFGIPRMDTQSGFWALRRSALPLLGPGSPGMSFSEEIKIEAFTRKDMRAGQWIVEYRGEPRPGTSKLRPFRDGLSTFLFLWIQRGRHFLRIHGEEHHKNHGPTQ